MKEEPNPAGTRSHETIIEIAAPIEDVWKAISEAPDLARWFAPSMTVEPGAGGSVLADWGPGLAWKTAIEIWEPNRHLRLTETRDRVMSSSPVEESLPPSRLIQDFFLESAGGRTVLRLVHSGFGSSAAWDTEYEGTRGGWAVCFLRMKHVLELHRGEHVDNFILPWLCRGAEHAGVLSKIESLVPEPLENLSRGPYHLCGLMRGRNGSFFCLSVQPCPLGAVAYLEFVLYDQGAAVKSQIEQAWRTIMAEQFPGEQGDSAKLS